MQSDGKGIDKKYNVIFFLLLTVLTLYYCNNKSFRQSRMHSLDIQSWQSYTSVCLKDDRHSERPSASGRKFVLAVPALPGAVTVPTADSQEISAWLLLQCVVQRRPQR